MKTKEELEALKKEVENVSKKIAELSEEELKEVAGGQTEAGTTPVIASPLIGGVAAALWGKVPGVIMASGENIPGKETIPGEENVQIGGTASVPQSNNPLIIPDGLKIGTSDN